MIRISSFSERVPLVELLLDHLGCVLVVGGVLLAGVDAHLQHLRPHVLRHVSLNRIM